MPCTAWDPRHLRLRALPRSRLNNKIHSALACLRTQWEDQVVLPVKLLLIRIHLAWEDWVLQGSADHRLQTLQVGSLPLTLPSGIRLTSCL